MDQLQIIRKVDSLLTPLYRVLPYTHYGITTRLLQNSGDKLLDVACGNGQFMAMLNKNRDYRVTGVDIFTPYLKLARETGVYSKLIKSNIQKLPFKRKTFDICLCSQAIEHLTKDQGFEFMKQLEKIARRRVVFITPAGEMPQDTYDGNRYQKHLSTWYARDFTKNGYKVTAQGLKLLYGSGNAVKKWGIVSYLFAVISFLSTPLLTLNPDWGVYLFCSKDL